VVPVVPLLNATGVIVAPEQMVWDDGVADATGPEFTFTSTVAVIGAPIHPLAVGVMVNVTVMGDAVLFVNIPVILLPDPVAAIPVTEAALSLAQVYVTPGIPLLNAIVVIVAPEKIVCDNGVADAAVAAFTSTVAVIGAPVQPLAVGVIVNVTVIGDVVLFVNTPVISPDPLVAIPVTGTVLSLVQV
jgi:hypothetical protein